MMHAVRELLRCLVVALHRALALCWCRGVGSAALSGCSIAPGVFASTDEVEEVEELVSDSLLDDASAYAE